MTPEELDWAIGREALRICEERPGGLKFRELAQTAARLAREGYTPPEPVDPYLLVVVREIVAKVFEEKGWHDAAGQARKGQTDKGATLIAALDAYNAGREAEAERAKVLVETLEAINEHYDIQVRKEASDALKAYRARKEAGR